jgi:hypothetical protein
MKRFILAAAAAAMFTASSASVSSADHTAVSVLNAETTNQAATEVVVVESAPVMQSRRVYRRRPTNVFQNLMEMERRKNAWLRRTFLGR